MQHHTRRSIWLRDYDYRQAGAYFVAVCVQGRACALGVVMGDNVLLTESGRIAKECWYTIPTHFDSVTLDEFIIMPNHVHGILTFEESVWAGSPRPTAAGKDTYGVSMRSRAKGAETAPLRHPTLGQVVAYFKYQSTKRINADRRTPDMKFWQPNYYEHIIRNEVDLNEKRRYIELHPLKWALDPENPESK